MTLSQRIEEAILAGSIELPVLPECAMQVRDLVHRESTIQEIAAVIERDPGLAAGLIRHSNSVTYAGLREITELSQAISRLGTRAVWETVLAVSVRNVFRSEDPWDERVFRALWNHSIATALAARRIAGRGTSVRPEVAFLAGLLHDIGKVLVLRTARELRGQGSASAPLSEGVLYEFFDALHCRVGDRFLETWCIPEAIRTVVRRHHEGGFVLPADELLVIVAFSNQVAKKLGFALVSQPDLVLLDLPEAALLRLNDVKLASLMVDLEDDMAGFANAA